MFLIKIAGYEAALRVKYRHRYLLSVFVLSFVLKKIFGYEGMRLEGIYEGLCCNVCCFFLPRLGKGASRWYR